jgi:tRNA pseudouridine55 synthase
MITKKLSDFSSLDFLAGEAILIDKEIGDSSFRAVNRLRKIIGVKKVGHAGTLDPAATGLLIMCTGKMTKQIYKYQDLHKTYTGIISLGKTTDSMDAETDFTSEKGIDGITENMIISAREKFTGDCLQIPPMYSALKHKGKRLYRYARKGEEVKREPRPVKIHSFEILKIELPDVYFRIICSKGTYIRVIADDFGKELGSGAYLKSLRRTAIGEYSVEDAFTLEELNRNLTVN